MRNHEIRKYAYNVDFYWKSLAMYGAALLLYAVLKGTIDEGTLSIALSDPIVILLGGFVLFSSIALFINFYTQRVIVIGEDFIAFRNRFRERVFRINVLQSIMLRKERRFTVNSLKVVKIYVHGKRRPLRLRPSLFENEHELLHDLTRLKKLIPHHHHS